MLYTNSKGRQQDIRDLPYSHLKNAVAALEGGRKVEQEEGQLAAMKALMAEREAAWRAEHPDAGDQATGDDNWTIG